MNWMQILSAGATLLASLAGAGPWGVVAMALGGAGLIGGIAFLIAKWNKNVDAGDLARAGKDAGDTSVDLKNQADANRDFENRERDEILKNGPPKDGEIKP